MSSSEKNDPSTAQNDLSEDKNWKVYKGHELSNKDYHAEKEHSSSSNLKDLIATGPSRYDKDGLWGIEKYHREKVLGLKKEQKENNAFSEGSLAHCLILEPHMLEEDFAIYPGFRKAGNDFKTFKAAEIAGKNRTIISKSQFKKVEGWVEGYRLNKTAVDLIQPCNAEYSLFGELNGVKIKVRADAINIEKGYIADVKTTAYETDKDSFSDTVSSFQYELSGALYAKMFSLYYGKPFDFYFVVLGKRDRSCEVFKLGDGSRAKGDKKIRDALANLKLCRDSGLWVNKKGVDKLEIKCYDGYEIEEV